MMKSVGRNGQWMVKCEGSNDTEDEELE